MSTSMVPGAVVRRRRRYQDGEWLDVCVKAQIGRGMELKVVKNHLGVLRFEEVDRGWDHNCFVLVSLPPPKSLKEWM